MAGCDVSVASLDVAGNVVIALTEARAGRPRPIVTDIGALAERVQDGVDGYKVSPDDPGSVRNRLIGLHYDRARLARMQAAIATEVLLPSVDDHLETVPRAL